MNRGEMNAPTFNLGMDRVTLLDGELNKIAITQDVKALRRALNQTSFSTELFIPHDVHFAGATYWEFTYVVCRRRECHHKLRGPVPLKPEKLLLRFSQTISSLHR